MERCDFVSVAAIIRDGLKEGAIDNQMDFVCSLFNSYTIATDSFFDAALVNRWLKGNSKISPGIIQFYNEKNNRAELVTTFEDAIIPELSDSSMTVQRVYELIVQDASISERKKKELCLHYPCRTEADDAAFLSSVIIFCMNRSFQPRASGKQKTAEKSLSPILADFVYDEGLPKPCKHFCGREQELVVLHEALQHNGKVFLHGIPGVGKSELAKAYAKEHEADYTNILFFTYSGSLKLDITNMDFADDLPTDDETERFRKHNRFLRTLKEDTLLIIDNFNTTSTRDELLSVVLKYRCRILFTTRSTLPDQCCILVEEISSMDTLFELASAFYSDAEQHRSEVEQIIETVHRHTLAVELAARLLETGLLEPQEVLDKLREEHASFDAADKVNISKDGKNRKATYYEHIHTLFALFGLPVSEREIMRNLSLIPLTGIPARLFGKWLALNDLNDVNEMIEFGLIQSRIGNKIALHPMMQEVSVSDFPPGIVECRTMLEAIRATCLIHGENVPYHAIMFQTVENTIELAVKNDMDFYLLLMEDVFQYMENYSYQSGMQRLIDAMAKVLRDASVGSNKDRALLLDCRAACEKRDSNAIKLLTEALSLLPEVTENNALLVSNLHANLGALYRSTKKNDLAASHMKAAIDILNDYELIGGHDSIIQYINYAVLLSETGRREEALEGLRRMEPILRTAGALSSDYAQLLETMGMMCLGAGQIDEGTDYMKRALSIYEKVWTDEPDLVEAKKEEIRAHYAAAGMMIAKGMRKRPS